MPVRPLSDVRAIATAVGLLLVSLVTGTGPLRWLAPSAGLVALALALTTRLRVEAATGCAAAVWALATLGPAALQVSAPVGLQPGSTLGWLALAGASLLLLVLQQERLDHLSNRGAQR